MYTCGHWEGILYLLRHLNFSIEPKTQLFLNKVKNILVETFCCGGKQSVWLAAIFNRREPAIALAAARAEGSIGTVLSSVPWMISVGMVKAAMSLRKSVLPKASIQSWVAFGLAMIAKAKLQSSRAG